MDMQLLRYQEEIKNRGLASDRHAPFLVCGSGSILHFADLMTLCFLIC